MCHHQYRQQLAFLPVPDGNCDIGEPQIALCNLARAVDRAIDRIDSAVLRSDLPDTVLENRDRVLPFDPLRDHRCRHSGKRRQQRPHLRFDGIDLGTARRALVLRRTIRCDRPRHSIYPDSEAERDLAHRYTLGPVQSADFRPVFH